jgi:hypothetical protein
MVRCVSLGIFIATATACAGPRARPVVAAEPEPSTGPTDAPRALLVIVPLSIEVVRVALTGTTGAPTSEHPWPITTVLADGRVRVGDQPIGRIVADGTFVSPTGETVAHLDAAGRIHIGGVRTDASLDADGTLRNGSGDELRIEADGRVHGTSADAPELRVTGAGVDARRAAMFVIVLGLLSDGGAHVSVGRAPAPR